MLPMGEYNAADGGIRCCRWGNTMLPLGEYNAADGEYNAADEVSLRISGGTAAPMTSFSAILASIILSSYINQ